MGGKIKTNLRRRAGSDQQLLNRIPNENGGSNAVNQIVKNISSCTVSSFFPARFVMYQGNIVADSYSLVLCLKCPFGLVLIEKLYRFSQLNLKISQEDIKWFNTNIGDQRLRANNWADSKNSDQLKMEQPGNKLFQHLILTPKNILNLL